MIGTILTTNLLNTGIAFLAGGWRRQEQYFNMTVVQTMNDLLLITVSALIIPTASSLLSNTPIPTITDESRGSAVILIIVYFLYLGFEFKTHRKLFEEESKKVIMRPRKHEIPRGEVNKGLAIAGAIAASQGRPNGTRPDRPSHDLIMDRKVYEAALTEGKKKTEEPELHLFVSIITLIVGTVILAFNTKFMTDSIDGLVTNAGVSRDFIGIVLLPILSNDLAAIQLAIQDEMNVALHAALGKSLQATLLVMPVLVLVGWGMDIQDMNLLFDGFQVVALFISVLNIQNGISSGTSTWYVAIRLLHCGC